MNQTKPRVVVHEDDLGSSHGANVAFIELTRIGICTTGSVMVPCPWFIEVAELQAKDPSLDIGVHLTLNAEYEKYRWRPLTSASKASGLVDDNGLMWRTVPEVRAHAHPDAVEAELRAQIEAAKTAGIDITHLDAHMGAVMCTEFVDIYRRLGREFGVPVVLIRPENAHGNMERGPAMADAVRETEALGLPVFDVMLETPWERGTSVEADYDALLGRASPGLSYMALHFNAPGDIETISPEGGDLRVEEYALFRSGWFRDEIARRNLEPVGMRGFRDKMRAKGG